MHKHAAKIGVLAALVCRLLPHNYKAICDLVHQLCGAGAGH